MEINTSQNGDVETVAPAVVSAVKDSRWNEFLKDNFAGFMEAVIGLQNQQFHDELDDIISNPIYRKICVAYPRGHGKSTHLSVGYPLWEMARNRNIRILIVSSTASIAAGFVNEIHNHLEGNERYLEWSANIDKQGIPVRPKKRKITKMEEKWAGNAFTIERDNLNQKDPTVQAIGVFGSSLSKRADIIICDDVVNQQNSETEDQRQKIKDWVYTTLMPILDPVHGRFLYLGNTWHQDDLVANLLADPTIDYRDKKASIITDAVNQEMWHQWADVSLNEDVQLEERKNQATQFYIENKVKMDEGITLMWPGRFTYEFLYMERLRNPYSFARMYQCDPSKRPDQKIKDEWLEKAVSKGKHLILQDEPRKGLTMRNTTAGLDLAISQKKGSDDTVFLTLDLVLYGDGEILPGDFIIRNIERGKMTPAQVREMVVQKYSTIRHTGIRVESVQYQESMAIDLSGFGLPIKSYSTGREKNDPEIGVYSLANILERGKFVIPYNRADTKTIMLCSQLMNELRNWPDGHTGDSLMSLWFAYAEMREHIGSSYSHPKTSFDVQREVIKEIEAKQLSDVDKRKALEKLADLEAMRIDQARRKGDNFVPSGPHTATDSPYTRKFTF